MRWTRLIVLHCPVGGWRDEAVGCVGYLSGSNLSENDIPPIRYEPPATDAERESAAGKWLDAAVANKA